MAYSGTTAATSLVNPPRNILSAGMSVMPGTTGLTTTPTQAPGGQGGALWMYNSTNLTTDITASNFFTDGKFLGMRPGDLIFGSQFTSAGSSVTSFMGSIVGVSTSGASLSTGSLVTSTFN